MLSCIFFVMGVWYMYFMLIFKDCYGIVMYFLFSLKCIVN